MKKKKQSFFEKLTGSMREDDDMLNDEFEDGDVVLKNTATVATAKDPWLEEEGELTVDVHQTPNSVIVKTMMAGVKPEDIEIKVTRDMITIRGKRESEKEVKEDDYFHKELYWGSFSRTIMLPCEVESEEAEAKEDHGLIIVTLPKIDKKKETKVKVK